MDKENLVTRYANWVVNHPWIVIFSTLLLVAAAASGMRFVKFTTDYRVFFSEDNPELVAFDALESVYTKNDNVMFVITPKDGNVFSPETLQTIKQLTKEAWQTPHSIRVDSITNYQHTAAQNDDLTVKDLVADDDILDPPTLHSIKEIALNEPLLIRRLISPTGHVTGVNITIQLPGIDKSKEVPETVAFVRALAQKTEASNPNIEIRLSGMTMMNNAFAESSQADMKSLVLLSFVLMLITLALLIRGLTGTLGTFFVILFSIMTAMGIGMYIGFPITPPSASTPSIVLTVAIANSVHILVTFLHAMRDGSDQKTAMIESLRINMQPVFLASATTAIGFLTMNFADVPPFKHLGTMVSIGVLASFFLSVYFLPAFMTLLPVKVKSHKHRGSLLMGKLGNFVVVNNKRLLWGMVIFSVVLISFLPKNELNDVFVHYFDETVSFRKDADYMTENLTGLYIIDYSLEAKEPGGVSDPEYLQEVEKFGQWYREQSETLHVNTITDIMKRLNRNMHGDDDAWYKTPEARDLAAQYLLLYEMSLPYGLDLNNQINIDKSATRFTVTLKTVSTNQLLGIEERAQNWLRQNTHTIAKAHGTGTSIMFAHIGKANIKSMLMGTAVALVLISFILIFALKSLKIGLISMIPNLIPAALGFGLWGILVGEIGLGLSVVAGMTLGIVVDDTVHFLSKYLRARREKKLSPPDAVRYAFTSVGLALVITSVVLVVGFAVLAFSSFYLNAGMGTLTAIVIAFALLADFLLLPPLLMMFDKERKDEVSNSDSNVATGTAST